MKQRMIPAGGGDDFDWAQDHVFVKAPFEASDGRVTLVEDTLKPGFVLARHHHRSMVEIFYILDGSVSFTYDDEQVDATAGATVIVPPRVWHGVASAQGARLLTVFSPGGFDHCLSALAGLAPEQFADSVAMDRLGEKYDIWTT